MRTDGRRLPHNLLEQYRLAAINLYKSKVDIKVIAQSFGVTVQAVYKWVWKFEQEGLGSLKSTTAQGAAPQLSRRQFHDFLQALQQPAAHAGFQGALWTSPKVRLLIQKLFSIDYHPKHLPRFLRRLGLTIKSPGFKASKHDTSPIRQWKDERLQEILAEARRNNSLVFFADEKQITLVPGSGSSWTFPKIGPSGVGPNDSAERLGIICAVNEQGRTYFDITPAQHLNPSERFSNFMRNLIEEFPSRGIVLIVDAALSHTDSAVTHFLENNPQLRLELLPIAAFDEKGIGSLKSEGKSKASKKDENSPTDD